MQWEFIVALALAIPIILFPAAYVWYLNIGGVYAAAKRLKTRQTARGKAIEEKVDIDELPLKRNKNTDKGGEQ